MGILFAYHWFLAFSHIYEDQHTPDHMRNNPGKIQNTPWVYMVISGCKKERKTYGKWLVFKYFDEIDEQWKEIVHALKHDELQGCTSAKCSTLFYQPTLTGPGPKTTAVICVYTCEYDMDAIGFKLVELVKQDIKYKTEVATHNGQYTYRGSGVCTIKNIYYNNGKPSFELKGERRFCNYFREDIWHLNVVECPELSKSEVDYGRWILTLEEYSELTHIWHLFKKMIELEKEKFGALKMICPPKRVRKSSSEIPVFHIYTSKEKMKSVGSKLINVIKQDIVFERKQDLPPFTTLYWNDGEPSYEVVRQKGITRNWRTDEEMK